MSSVATAGSIEPPQRSISVRRPSCPFPCEFRATSSSAACTTKRARTGTAAPARRPRAANVAPHDLAKSVVVEDDAGCVMAVVPADRNVKLSRMLGRKHLRLADEQRIAELFTDCERGAVPTLGMAWDFETVVNDELETSTMEHRGRRPRAPAAPVTRSVPRADGDGVARAVLRRACPLTGHGRTKQQRV